MVKKDNLNMVIFFSNNIKKLRFLDIFGVFVFFTILILSAFFLLRKSDEIFITLRLFERDAPSFNYNLPNHFFIENLKPGLTETDELGRNALEILEIYRYPSGETSQEVFVTLKVRSVYNSKTGQHSFNGKPLLVGSYQTFRLINIELNGVIIDIKNEPIIRERKTFQVEAYVDPAELELTSYERNTISSFNLTNISGIRNFVANKIIPGLKMYDSGGNVVSELIDVVKSPGYISYISGSNTILNAYDPERTKVNVTLKVVTEKINDTYYFQRKIPLVVGVSKKLEFISDNLRFLLTITSVKEIE